MPESLDIDYLQPFIESTIDAAARFRRVLIIMVTASILAFGAFWNSLDETWFNSRIGAARSGEAYLTLEDISYKLAKIEKDLGKLETKKQGETNAKEIQSLEETKVELVEEKQALLNAAIRILKERFQRNLQITQAKELEEELKTTHYFSVKGWISQRMMPNKEQAAQYAQKLEEARTGNILLIHIPLSGSVFDVNTLGLWGGTTFAVILLLFRFSLWREYNNLKLTFLEAKPEHLRFCYISLAMQQVLTVPPALSLNHSHLKPKGKIIRLLYFPPLIIQLAIITNDIRTESVGEIFSSYLTLISIGSSISLLFFIIRLTIKCLDLSAAIDKEWGDAAHKVRAAILEKWAVP